ncbi:MAG: PQQ-binding-like beta-propeller repeat protein [Arachnia sp.]
MSSASRAQRGPRRPRAARYPAAAPVTVLAVLAVLLGASGFLSAPGPSGAHHRAAELVGDDGHREFLADGDGAWVLETARLRGGPLLASGPQSLALAEDDLDALLSGDFVRVSRTQRTGDDILRSLSLQRLDDTGVATVAELDDDGLRLFRPPLVLLPPDVRAGDSWRGSGEVVSTAAFTDSESAPYSFEAHASIPEESTWADADCLTVERFDSRTDGDIISTATWCPGRGVVTDGDATPDDNPNKPAFDGTPRPRLWDPAGWEFSSTVIPLAPPMQWGTDLAPVPVDGALVVAHQTSGDLIFLPPGGPDEARRAHPGGAVTMLAALGDTVLAATTRSRLTAWHADGSPVWEVDTRDLISQPPVLLGGTLLVADDSGHLVGVDAATGRESWHTALGEHLTAAPVVCGDTVLVATAGPRLLALGGDGTQRWERDLDDRADALACTGTGVAVAVGSIRLHHVALDGTPMAEVPLRVGIVDELLHVGGMVVARSDLGLSAHDPARAMAQVWRFDESVIDAATDGTTLVVLGTDGFTALDDAGSTVARWEADVAPAGSAPHLVADVDSVLVLGTDMTIAGLR